MNALLAAVREGRSADVPGLLSTLGAEERKAALAELKALRSEVRGWDWDRWDEQERVRSALLVAGTGCHTGAAALAAWIGARELRSPANPPYEVLLDLLKDRRTSWLGDLAHRLAGRASTAQDDFPLIQELVRLSGCPVPTTDGFVHGWAEAMCPARDAGPAALREDPHVRTLVPLLFETAELARSLAVHDDPTEPRHWPAALADLAAEGVVERSVLVERCVLRLLRGGRPGEMRFLLHLLRRLALTAREEHAFAAEWAAMAADGLSTVASHAQGVLGRLAERGELSPGVLSDVSAAVLFRPEKKLVRGQLMLLGKVLGAAGSAVEDARVLLPVVAEAFGHPDIGIQDRALKLVGRHLSAVDDDVRAELAEAAAQVGPVHRQAAIALFGELPAAADGYEEILPPVPLPRRLEPAPASVAELVEQLVALRPDAGVAAFERVLDGLVRFAHRDRERLAEALRDALADRWWFDDAARQATERRFLGHSHGLDVVAAALLGKVSAKTLNRARSRPARQNGCVHAALEHTQCTRLWEAAHFAVTRPLPFLLSTPTWHTGTLEPDELLERLSVYRRLGVTPGPADFGQALLRVRRTGATAARTAGAAAGLGTKEADWLANWLTAPEPVPTAPRVGIDGGPASSGPEDRHEGARQLIHETRERWSVRREFPASLHWLTWAQDVSRTHCFHWAAVDLRWPAVLPQDRETLAAWQLRSVLATAVDEMRGNASCLPPLAEAEGHAGPALHRLLACGLGARHGEDRLSAVDALLVLAARGQLDSALLGRELAELALQGTVKLNRLADAVRTAAVTGAYATTWAVLAALLPPLLGAAPGPRGLAGILGVAAECTERCGAAVACEAASAALMDRLAALAGKRASSDLVRQASRLLVALGH
ncbi:DUF6493 family protein [Streptomyces sp. NPDC058572]|uniref:DUF7824 domain-containing protein n=1 Tax=Streptomyces sp. NPDC058572 TaxID=3346546 RepID=UPI003669A4EF